MYLSFSLLSPTVSVVFSIHILQRWLDPTKPIRKQLKSMFDTFGIFSSIFNIIFIASFSSINLVVCFSSGRSPHSLNFRVKFFVTDPNKLQEEYTR